MNGSKYDPDIYKKNRTRSDNSHFSGDDLAGRLAIATKQDKFDLLAVYAVRERGNYFSGTHGAGYYKRATPDSSLDLFLTLLMPINLAMKFPTLQVIWSRGC